MAAPPLLHVRRQLSSALYGEVLECELLGHDEPVAVKRISLVQAAEARNRAGASREIDSPLQEQRVAALLVANGGHRNVVQPHFNFVPSFLEEHEVLPLMRQVLEGVRYLHSTIGVAHRDLSLENVLLSRGVCKITDFGLSTDSRSICTGGQVGKEFYMAPEVVAGDRYDPTLADVWSLGIMWFIMLTGSPLITLASPSEKAFVAVKRHGVGAVIEVWGHSERISTDAIELLEKMLQIDPSRRIALDQVLTHPIFDTAVTTE
ncbi:hypothetical protein BBO99_00000407 [Phytophthora kernoviae]|uniref:Protein kinase domain-containing protein n=2 Tax=Phytophthora kernoviae TaxID=325452 RepID=A0A3R7H3M4_9STRA|nr:hypothetical protein G195_001211 [Phytophthora kernoviae 00238/432]KAG2532216.1 hypothetical protein JM16_000458 [Phytophthora kernoviae]KAG2533247.1 hypothetical protein JM18_000512 [Phytophthora kernoviae]RLN14552.1 hypothetical protein BBI17_000410 [Phytophthora kernoviae]RLN85633.1 hypothetical protein BBO99_00000407 [Phytophthora kernoviae]